MKTRPCIPYARIVGSAVLALTAVRAPGQAVNNNSAPLEEPKLKLAPFEVQSDRDNSYGALNSNSITRFNTELDRLPISADIFTKTFMEDAAVASVEDLIKDYSAGAGYSGSNPESSAGGNMPGDRNSGAFMQLRGLQAPSIQRDGFLPAGSAGSTGTTGVGYSNTYNIERVEIINGPQALLYGASGAGGVMNLVSKQARFNSPPKGSFKFQINQYGGKLGEIDYGFGKKNFAARVVLLNQKLEDRRAFVGGPLKGIYLQVAGRVFDNTTIRLGVEQTKFDRIRNTTVSFAAQGGANGDARNGQNLRYLLATNQIAAAAGGRPSNAGVMGGGVIDWGTVDSLAGWEAYEQSNGKLATLNIETQWNKWLSTQLSAGYGELLLDNMNQGPSLVPPNLTANPLGVWAIGLRGANRGADNMITTRTKGIRFSILATNDFFDKRVHSQTILGGDFVGTYLNGVQYSLFRADENWNVIVNPAVTTFNGRTQIPAIFWSIANGAVKDPLPWRPFADRVTYNGVNYVRQEQNLVDPARISPSNPLGTTPGGPSYTHDSSPNRGIYGINYSQFGRLDTLMGFRLQDVYFKRETPGNANGEGAVSISKGSAFSYNVGADYKMLKWLTPYFSFSDSFNVPAVKQNDPYGDSQAISRARGEELGFKVTKPGGAISGSVSVYHVKSKDEQLSIPAALLNAINPEGLNGQLGNAAGVINVDRETTGVQMALTAAKSSRWRMRFSAAAVVGKIGKDTSYEQLYNDEFHANSLGQVTYADGAVVYVPATFSATRPTVAQDTPGATPLTITMLSSPTSSYYANPVASSGAINGASSAATVLEAVDPVHGPILTGRVGLPISGLQINPGFTPPGTIVTSEEGDFSVGFPKYSANFTNVYTVGSGWLKDLQIGGTVSASWYNRRFYYYPNGVSLEGARRMYSFPTQTRVNLLLGYARKFGEGGRFKGKLQLNVDNAFNSYEVMILPHALNGFAGPNNATFSQEPRKYTLTMTVDF